LTQLQHLELSSKEYRIPAEVLLSFLTSLKHLSKLALYYKLHQPEVDALLAHAPQLTSLTCRCLYLWEDRSASPCSWKELVMKDQGFETDVLAYIPTSSLTRLEFGGSVVFPSPSPTLIFAPWDMNDPDNMPQIVGDSLAKFMRCPAWQQCGPAVHVCLDFGEMMDGDMPEQLDLVSAIAPLISKELKLSIDMPRAVLGASVVQHLGVTLGSSLKQLVLGGV
jgi:hypothetical protein